MHHRGPQEPWQLATTLLDCVKHPAEELINLYRQRWEIEMAFDEIKNHLGVSGQDSCRFRGCGGELAHLERGELVVPIVLPILPYRPRGTSPVSKAMIARWTRSRASSLANRRAT